MKFERTKVFGIDDDLIYGIRLPLMSHDRSDSWWSDDGKNFYIGKNDLDLMQRLIKSGHPHDKFMRQIPVRTFITAPTFWWVQADTYKVGTVANSSSKMHKLASTPIDVACFDMRKLKKVAPEMAENTIKNCEELRQRYLETKDMDVWNALVELLPESWEQIRMYSLNYEVIYNQIRQRKGHKLKQWKEFINWAKTLPYAKKLLFYGLED